MDSAKHHAPGGPLRSEYAADPDMSELVAVFVRGLPARLDAILAAVRESDAGALARMVHQLTGAGSGYGFPDITNSAAEAERALREAGLGGAEERVQDLVALCRRACAGRSAERGHGSSVQKDG